MVVSTHKIRIPPYLDVLQNGLDHKLNTFHSTKFLVFSQGLSLERPNNDYEPINYAD